MPDAQARHGDWLHLDDPAATNRDLQTEWRRLMPRWWHRFTRRNRA